MEWYGGNQWHRHAGKRHGLGKWTRIPSYTIPIQGHFQRSHRELASCLGKANPAKKLGLLQTKMETWILFGVIFISDWEATQRDNKYTLPWEKGKRERESILLCHPPNTTNHVNLNPGTVFSLGRQGEFLCQRVHYTVNIRNTYPRATQPQTQKYGLFCTFARTAVLGR